MFNFKTASLWLVLPLFAAAWNAPLAADGDIESTMAADGGDCEEVLTRFAEAGIDVDALAEQLQDEGAKSFVKSWNDLLLCIASKCETVE